MSMKSKKQCAACFMQFRMFYKLLFWFALIVHAVIGGAARVSSNALRKTALHVSLSEDGEALGLLQKRRDVHVHRTSGGVVAPVSMPDHTTPVRVLISAFQDGDRCARTLGWALEKAAHPERIHFNVLQARGDNATRSDENEDCVSRFVDKHLLAQVCPRRRSWSRDPEVCRREVLARIHHWTISLDDGMGPAHQRGLLSERADFGATKDMCFSTDSHMDFLQDWDQTLIADWSAIQNEFAVLTTYPLSMNDRAMAKDSFVDLCGYYLDDDGIPRGMTGGTLGRSKNAKPYLTVNWAAGLSFGRCHAEHNVPVDKNLRFIFTGEEVDRALRLWTHGYDLYLPTSAPVLHDYNHAKQGFWQHNGGHLDSEHSESLRRLRSLLKLNGNTNQADNSSGTKLASDLLYKLGDQRTLEQYITWSRMNLGQEWVALLTSQGMKTATPDHNYCSTLKRIPVRDSVALQALIS